jgi:hypothetical protein
MMCQAARSELSALLAATRGATGFASALWFVSDRAFPAANREPSAVLVVVVEAD